MSYSLTSTDYAALAEAMLDDFKNHARIDFDDDDGIATKYLKWAISLVEVVVGFRIGATAIAWTPEPLPGQSPPTMSSAYPFPVTPVAPGWTVTSEGIDVTANFRMTSMTLLDPVILSTVSADPFPGDAIVDYSAGFDGPDSMPPNLESAIYRVAAQLYANRESVTSINVSEMPLWLNDLLVGLWLPRC